MFEKRLIKDSETHRWYDNGCEDDYKGYRIYTVESKETGYRTFVAVDKKKKEVAADSQRYEDICCKIDVLDFVKKTS